MKSILKPGIKYYQNETSKVYLTVMHHFVKTVSFRWTLKSHHNTPDVTICKAFPKKT